MDGEAARKPRVVDEVVVVRVVSVSQRRLAVGARLDRVLVVV
jgi:hypothetical protein